MLQAHITRASQITEHIPVLRDLQDQEFEKVHAHRKLLLSRLKFAMNLQQKYKLNVFCINLHRFTGLFEFVRAIAAHFCAVNLINKVMVPCSTMFFLQS